MTGNDQQHDFEIDGTFFHGQGIVDSDGWYRVAEHVSEETATARECQRGFPQKSIAAFCLPTLKNATHLVAFR